MTKPRPVRCIDTGETYPSVTAAAQANYLDPSSISQGVRYGYRIGGRRWEYANGQQPGYKPGYHRNRRVERCDGRVFSSVKVAASEMGVTTATLYSALTKFRPARGYYWRYLDD